MVVLPVLFLLGSLFLCGRVEAQSNPLEVLKQAAGKTHKLPHFIHFILCTSLIYTDKVDRASMFICSNIPPVPSMSNLFLSFAFLAIPPSYSSPMAGTSDLWKVGLQLYFQSPAWLLLCSQWHVPNRRGNLHKDYIFVAPYQRTE